jgi:hypothetical protein
MQFTSNVSGRTHQGRRNSNFHLKTGGATIPSAALMHLILARCAVAVPDKNLLAFLTQQKLHKLPRRGLIG